MMQRRAALTAMLAGALLAAAAPRGQAIQVLPEPTYADLVDLADSAPLVVPKGRVAPGPAGRGFI
jgi:hypothetical protein